MAGVAPANGRAVLAHEGQTALANGIERGRMDSTASGVQQHAVDVAAWSAPATGRGERRARILIVARDPALTAGIARALREAGYEVGVASSATPVRDVILDDETYDLITLDVQLPGAQGFAVLKTLRKWGVQTPVLLMTAGADVVDTIGGLDLGADDVTAKPVLPTSSRRVSAPF
jgi:CheY-like chemotaxis protein